MPPVLYSFRRCPYAMRARLAIRYSQITVELREVDLKHKPEAMLQASRKATVPVLVCENATVIDESMEIMLWALTQNDPQHWQQSAQHSDINSLIQRNDDEFKIDLDHYKYADRFPDHTPLYYRQQGERFLGHLEQRLHQQTFLVSNTVSLADIALFPFIRQFAHVDITWFESSPYPNCRNWLTHWLDSDLFNSIMQKQLCWEPQQKPVIF